MISGTGTVFSSGIDLTTITGDLLRSAFIGPSSCDSSRSSSSSSANVFASRNSNHHKIGADNSKSHHSDNTNCSFSQTNYDSNLNSSSHRNANRVHSFFCSPNASNVGRLAAALRSFLLALVSFPKPVVVGVNGPALGLAVAILPLCDIVYISDSATFYMPYTRLGQIPEGASTYTLNSLVGMPLANELLLAGRKLSAREALQRGLASDLLFPKSFKQELLLRCRKLAENSCMVGIFVLVIIFSFIYSLISRCLNIYYLKNDVMNLFSHFFYISLQQPDIVFI
ncbi:Chromodomain Y-like protein 2, variant 2 [Schistosoma haematobium]|uniref:Chromodomain Y-like protein 2, variant 2 n=1 Tax=Schistosoma haematobium TaxID=6185 RepID=A0A922LPY0_SCHHA|nr:Chromodomain Y-like protein 2, variant 2 [Schistosoma haematobium]KAH9591248.1 Chromodomain Y-like protein 2, variant 2 [Schistosoma haematobium]